ncbi:hypothetical protein [Proteiniborus sp. MB09-C3]|nr:hypothetical protein [Proteiniborus sp. MB09-C3]WIV13658.1 hypothetical protein QO263_08135 [Proteiniborus sp. MB09-C3]
MISNIKGNDTLRRIYNSLDEETFDLPFEGFYQNGYWTNKYIP